MSAAFVSGRRGADPYKKVVILSKRSAPKNPFSFAEDIPSPLGRGDRGAVGEVSTASVICKADKTKRPADTGLLCIKRSLNFAT